MNKYHMSLVIIFSIVVLKYNLSAFVQPLSFESISEDKSTVWIKNQDIGNDNKMMMEEVQALGSLWPVDSGHEGRDHSVSGRI
ncbi:MAG: hypothetical protein ACR2PB_14975 [Desulfocapsaceae bacterium]